LEIDRRFFIFLDVVDLDLGQLDFSTNRDIIEDQDDVIEEKNRDSILKFLKCPAHQFWSYRTYIEDKTPYSTQHGVKGAEFERVLVVIDEDEGSHSQYSYEKLFQLRELSATDLEHKEKNEDSTIERTRRLFYVCCSRALGHLAIVMYTNQPSKVEEHFVNHGLLNESSIVKL
jgi:DNA helicase II / ATP-dependent DNA helicase PcrA